MKKPEVAIIMGSDSDLEIMSDAAKVLEEFGVVYEITVVSAHRTPDRMYEFAKSAQDRGIKVIIAGAGGAAHLPGMTASITNLPVIGVPIKTKTMDGIDSLLSIAQMPPGIPVATVSMNGSINAAIVAIEILAISSRVLYKKLENYRNDLKQSVEQKASELESTGFEKYLAALKPARNASRSDAGRRQK